MSHQFAKDVVMDGVRGRGENLFLGLLAGLLAAVLGAGIWMGVALSGWHLGVIALGVGALVGLAIRITGNGTGMIYGIMGAMLTLLSCLSGEVLARIQRLTTAQHDFYGILTTVDLSQLVTAVLTDTSALTYLICGIGVIEAYTLSIRK